MSITSVSYKTSNYATLNVYLEDKCVSMDIDNSKQSLLDYNDVVSLIDLLESHKQILAKNNKNITRINNYK